MTRLLETSQGVTAATPGRGSPIPHVRFAIDLRRVSVGQARLAQIPPSAPGFALRLVRRWRADFVQHRHVTRSSVSDRNVAVCRPTIRSRPRWCSSHGPRRRTSEDEHFQTPGCQLHITPRATRIKDYDRGR